MVKKFNSILLTFILLMSLCVLSPLSASAATDTVKTYDVYVTGNYMIGETLTAHCKYYDSGEDVENVTYQWYRRTKFGTAKGSFPIEGETNPTYVVQNTDWGLGSDGVTLVTTDNNLITVYVQATITNADGSTTKIYSEYLWGAFLPNGRKGKPSVASAYIKPLNAEGSMKVGDTLAARFAYQNDTAANGNYGDCIYVPEKDSRYEWQTRTSLSDENPITVQAKSTDNTYTLKSDDFGKIIECVITPVAADGEVGESFTAKNHYGNLFYKQEGTDHSGSKSFSALNISRLELIRDGGGRPLYSTDGTTASVIIDIGSPGTFDAIYLKLTDSTAGYLRTVEYSIDGADESYTKVYDYNDSNKNTVTWIEDGTNRECEFKLDELKVARYFKATFEKEKGKYASLFAFYPYATMQDSLKLLKEDSTVAETLEYDTNYTLQYRLDESADSTCYDYLAVYEQLYNGEELKSMQLIGCSTSEHDDYGKLSIYFCKPTSDESEPTGYTKKYILKAFSLSDKLRPNKDVGVWEVAAAAE